MNNYEFWENYLKNLKKELLKLSKEKEKVQIDLHIHSNYSADGKQSIKEILETTKSKGFDVISITDHDTLEAYKEIYNYVKDGFTYPYIVPGIEFTIDNPSYGYQCHFVELFLNPCDATLKEKVKISKEANFKRSQKQFIRLDHNMTIQEILKQNNLSISYEEYLEFLNNNNLVPEYTTLCTYLMTKFKSKKITNFQILDLLEKNNKWDIYEDRRKYKEKRYTKLRDKYLPVEENFYSTRLLLSMLGVKEVDDDWWDEPMCGSISVNSYGQLKVEELNKNYPLFFAHPMEEKIKVVEDIIKNNPHVIGLELNVRTHYEDLNNFKNLLKKYHLKMSIGSDSHDSSLSFYGNLEFYQISSKEFQDILKLRNK